MKISERQLTPFFSGAASAAVVIFTTVFLTGAKDGPVKAHFDEITVGRINIAEPDGTKRLIISNKAQFPGAFEQGKEIARPDRASFAGMLFLDEEGNENGGLIQKGSRDAQGKIRAGLSLTFDRYRQDQAMQLLHTNNEKSANSAIMINDVPYYETTSISDLSAFSDASAKLSPQERDAYWKKLSTDGRLSENRIRLGTTGDKASALALKDARGRTRMLLIVNADGQAQISMLDEHGNTVKSIKATD
ncbi:hypothetical protein [Undibacterium luofuense]|uniref:hypothetical protein n=1 Tax=Undibacterium luofuense TaxID=2828733 RepID=UPI001E55F471|nr:hypothetical protein [Undibacterium luofuense]